MNPFYKYFILIPVLFLNVTINGQSLTKQLGGVDTEFIITSDTRGFNKEDQILIQRAVNGYSFYSGAESSYGYGYGYQAWHLEFTGTLPIVVKKENGKKRNFFKIIFIDEANHPLANIEIDASNVKLFSNERAPIVFSYSINLKDVPLIILDKTQKIDIIEYDHSRQY